MCGVQGSSPALPGRTTGGCWERVWIDTCLCRAKECGEEQCGGAGLGPPGKRNILESLWWDRAAVPESLQLLDCQGSSADATHIPRNLTNGHLTLPLWGEGMVQTSFVLVFAEGRMNGRGVDEGVWVPKNCNLSFVLPRRSRKISTAKACTCLACRGWSLARCSPSAKKRRPCPLSCPGHCAQNTLWGWRECNGGRNSKAAVSFLTTD